MIYRTSHRATYQQMNENLGSLSYRIAELTNQMASQKRINTISDDPTGAARVLETRGTLQNIEQYKSNLGVADVWLDNASTSVQSIKNTLEEIYAEASIQGSTDTYNDTQKMQILVEKVEGLFESLMQYGNASVGENYIFGGQDTKNAPFSLKVEAQQVINGSHNSEKWNGKVQNYGDSSFNSRPDLPSHGQNFLIEVVQAGGVDSRFYSNASANAGGSIKGDGYSFDFRTTNPTYNDTEINFVAGAANRNFTGDASSKNGLSFTNIDPHTQEERATKVVYTYSDTSAETTASWESGDGTSTNPDILTVHLRTEETSFEQSGTTTSGATHRSLSSAGEIQEAIEKAQTEIPQVIPDSFTAKLTDGNTGTGTVEVGQTSFNYGTTVDVNEDTGQITVYLEQGLNKTTGKFEFTATADDVLNALQNNPEVTERLDIELIPAGIPLNEFTTQTRPNEALISPTATGTKLQIGDPYTLAHTTMNPKGSQNDLVWSVKNNTDFVGSAGNHFSVEYEVPRNPFKGEAYLDYDPETGAIKVTAAVDESIYYETFNDVFGSPDSPAYQDTTKANEIALQAAIKTTANDVKSMVAGHPELKNIIDVELADGSSGEGNINQVPKNKFADGYSQPALFRVSQDGGKTWGPPTSFAASEYETGEKFYNSTLGHASLTSDFSTKGANLVFTAEHQGTWGNDVRVEYAQPRPPQTEPSLTIGSNPWDIKVNLGTDAEGNITTTAEDIMELINNDPQVSQFIGADLANYHEGGKGVVGYMGNKSLTVGEPYEVNGQSVITKLGYAETTIKSAAHKSPNIIFQAIEKGEGGDDIGIRYTTSADPTFHTSAEVANNSYQETTTVRYETDPDNPNKTIMVVHLATEELPTPLAEDADQDTVEDWNEKYPSDSLTSARAVTSTAGAVVEAIIAKNIEDPASAVVWPQLERWPDGQDPNAKVGPTDGTQWLSGGKDVEDPSDHGVNLRFIPDGTAMQVGDVFNVPVGWYSGDDKEMEVNTGTNSRTALNFTGDSIFGDNGEEGNILDTVQRLIWGLKQGDSGMVGKELPILQEAISKITTLGTQIGIRQQRTEFAENNLEENKYSSESLLSSIEDVDFSTLISDLKNADTVYQAVLGAVGMTNKVSLLNYI